MNQVLLGYIRYLSIRVSNCFSRCPKTCANGPESSFNVFLSPNKWWFIPSIWLVTNVYFLLSLPFGTLHEAVRLISKQCRDGTTQSRSWREYMYKTHGIYGSVSWIDEIVRQAKLFPKRLKLSLKYCSVLTHFGNTKWPLHRKRCFSDDFQQWKSVRLIAVPPNIVPTGLNNSMPALVQRIT